MQPTDSSPTPARRRIEIAAELITMASDGRPMDQLLRSEFKRRKGLPRRDTRLIAGIIQAYYRWLGWLPATGSVVERADEAMAWEHDYLAEPESFSDTDLLEKSAPAWIREEMEFTPDFARALQSKPVLWLRARPGQARALSDNLPECEPHEPRWRDAVIYSGWEDLFRNDMFQRGVFEIQDLNSQAIGWLCAPKEGEVWWDCCAGEGGKLLHLSDLMGNRGLIWASDTTEWRLEILRRRAARAGIFNYRAVLWKDEAKPPTKTKFDGVLVDAPCSGIGTWQRNPQRRWTTAAETIGRLAELQSKLLGVASGSVKPSGKLVYSVCTLSRRETTGVVAKFEEEHPEFQRVEEPNPWSGQKQREQWFWPQQTRGNGMFAAVWRRSPA